MDLRRAIVGHTERLTDRCVSVPEWGLEKVYLKRLSVGAFEALQHRLQGAHPREKARETVRVIMENCVDESGGPIFDFPDAPEVLLKAEARVVNRLALMISGDMPLLNTIPAEDGESEEDAAKNV
ncbi:MAG: hypothetical protein AAF183_17910 [Pseudomonadota bacterium]